MHEILIDKVIDDPRWGDVVSARSVREALDAFPEGETELQITVDSPGGDVFEGISIFNVIREFARRRADVRIRTYIRGMAASMASVIALAANSVRKENTVDAEDNAVFMVHDAWGIVIGNANDMRDGAEWFGRIDGILRDVYVRRTGKGEDEIRAMMDAETWLFGDEIIGAGFCDNIIRDRPQEDDEPPAALARESRIASARAGFAQARRAVAERTRQDNAEMRRDYRAAAMALGITAAGNAPAPEKNKGGCMKITVEDLRRDNPDVYAAIAEDGEKAGVQKEQARARRLLELGAKAGCIEYALECVKNGADPADAAVIDAFMDKGAAARALSAQAQDERVPDVTPPKNDRDADAKADAKRMGDAFDKAVKDGGYDDGDD